MTTLNVLSTPGFGRGAILILAAALLGACDADHTLGGVPSGGAGTNGTAGTTGTAGTSTAGSSSTGAAGKPAPVIGPLGPSQSWTGYVENHMFHSGSDVLKLTFATDSAGHAVGTIVFGQGTPPPPATDPNVGYPSALDADQLSVLVTLFAEGYPYAFSGTLQGNRLRFEAAVGQLWKDWCAMQTSYPPLQRCVPGSGTRWDPMSDKCDYSVQENQWTPVDCGKLLLCTQTTVCVCDATSCHSYERGGPTFDLQISGNTANGSTAGTVAGNVHFTKDP